MPLNGEIALGTGSWLGADLPRWYRYHSMTLGFVRRTILLVLFGIGAAPHRSCQGWALLLAGGGAFVHHGFDCFPRKRPLSPRKFNQHFARKPRHRRSRFLSQSPSSGVEKMGQSQLARPKETNCYSFSLGGLPQGSPDSVLAGLCVSGALQPHL